jgi:hypothetical protein
MTGRLAASTAMALSGQKVLQTHQQPLQRS